MQILAAVVDRPHSVPQVRHLTLEAPRANEVLVRIYACGVCHTDMVLRDGLVPITFPAVLGHEGAGVVEAIGDDIRNVAVGDRVVLTFRACGSCRSCAAQAPAYCELFFPLNMDGRRTDGSSRLQDELGSKVSGDIFGQSAFATYALAYQDNVVKVDTALPFEILGPLGCGIQTGAGTVLEALAVPAGSRVAILGAGAVGLSALMASLVVGASVIAILDRHESRLTLADELGATHLAREIDQLPEQLDYVIDTTGVTALAAKAGERLANRGTLALVGVYGPEPSLSLNPSFLMSGGRSVVGVVEGGVDPHRFIPKLVRMIEDGALPVARLIQTFSLADVAAAISASEKGTVIKPVLMMDGQTRERRANWGGRADQIS